MNKKSNKLISLLATFDRQQFKQCKKFLASPYFNRSEDLQNLFAELERRLSKELSLEKEKVWTSVWYKKSYDDVRFRKFSSDLLKLVEKYVILQELENSPLVEKRLWLSAVDRLKAKKQKEGILRNWEKEKMQLETKLSENAEKYFHLFHLERLKFKLSRYDSRTQDRSNIELIMEYLDIFYITEKLYAYNSANSTAFAKSHSYKIEFIIPIINHLKINPQLLAVPTIGLQYYNFLIESEPDDQSHYFAFKELLFSLTDDLSQSDLHSLFTTALNYCSRKVNNGIEKYMDEYLQVYKRGLAEEAVCENGFLPPQHFRIPIMTALRIGDFEWAAKYIKDYQDRIPKQYRENAVNLNLATFYFYQKDYEKAMEYLRDVEYENVTYNLNAKSMLLAIYYETDEFDALDSLFDAILAYLSRHKEIPVNYKRYFRNLVSVTRKMTRIIPGDKKAVEKLRNEVEEMKTSIASLKWVREKLDELA